MSTNLQYVYVGYNLETGLCEAVITTSYVIDAEGWVQVPEFTYDYDGKYYNFAGDQKFYWDEGFTRIWEECPSH